MESRAGIGVGFLDAKLKTQGIFGVDLKKIQAPGVSVAFEELFPVCVGSED